MYTCINDCTPRDFPLLPSLPAACQSRGAQKRAVSGTILWSLAEAPAKINLRRYFTLAGLTQPPPPRSAPADVDCRNRWAFVVAGVASARRDAFLQLDDPEAAF